MKVAVFSTAPYERPFLDTANSGHDLTYLETRLSRETVGLAAGFDAVAVFVNDSVDAEVLTALRQHGIRLLATRSAGYNHIDLEAADACGITVARVPAYSPNAVSEFTLALILTLGRRVHRAYNRVREHNFALTGLVGFELRDKTVGVVGTGKIGATVVRNLSGFGCRILAYDSVRNADVARLATYVDNLDDLLAQSDIVTLHVPLTPETHHLVDRSTVARFRRGCMLVNTSRGGLLDTTAIIEALKSGQIGSLAIDVYEEEADLFFRDLSEEVMADDVFARLMTFPNVLVTGHQAFLTDHALTGIAETTVGSLTEFEQTGRCTHAVTSAAVTT